MMTNAERLMWACVQNRIAAGIPVTRRPDAEPFEACGVEMHVRPMSAADLAAFARWFPSNQGRAAFGVFTLTVCGREGNHLFSLDDVPQVMTEFNQDIVAAVAEYALELNKARTVPFPRI